MSNLRRIVKIIKKNKLYVWLLIFIIAFNLLAKFNAISTEAKLEIQAKRIKSFEAKLPSAERIKQMVLNQSNIYAQTLFILFLMSFLALIIGAIIDIIFIVLKASKVEIIPRSSPSYKTNWKLIDIIRVIILFVFISYMVSIGYAFFKKVFGLGEFDTVSKMVTGMTLSYVIIISLLIYFISYKHRNKFKILGLHFKKFFRNIFLGIVGYIAIIPILALVVFIIMAISSYLKYTPEPQPLLDALFIEKNPFLFFYLLIIICFIGPLIEELFFRGFVYRALKERIGKAAAVMTSAVFFAWLHMTLIGFFPILILGILLAYLYEKNGTLIPSITVHMIHNSVIVIFLYLLKGLIL